MIVKTTKAANERYATINGGRMSVLSLPVPVAVEGVVGALDPQFGTLAAQSQV